MKHIVLAVIIGCVLIPAGVSAQKKPLSLGDEMPGFYLKDIGGEPFFMNDYLGKNPKFECKAVIFSLSASTCKPCKKEIPELGLFRDKYEKDGLKIFIIALEKEDQARKLVKETGTTLPVLIDKYLMIPTLLGRNGIPFTILVDRDRKVRYINTGFSEKNAHEFIEPFENAIVETLAIEKKD